MTTRKKRKKLHTVEPDDYLTDPSSVSTPADLEGRAGKLGERIAKIRHQRGLSMEDLASRTGMPHELLRRVEDNEYTPPLGELIRLGKALEMKMGYFISPGASGPYSIVRADQRQTIARFASGSTAHRGYVYVSLAPEKGDRAMEPFIVTMRPSDEQEISTHDGQEFIYVLEGRLEAHLGDAVEILEPGDTIYYDSSLPHLVRCHGDQMTRVLAVLYTEGK